MNVTGAELAIQYEVAIGRWPFLHDVERAHGLPPFLLAAVGSRETNLDRRYLDEPGDGGHGHGLWQLDDRSWQIPDPFPVELQAETAATFLSALLEQEGDLVAALNRYNSGSPRTERTTGADYGPDVMARREWLAAHYPVPPPGHAPAPKERTTMFTFTDNEGLVWLLLGGLLINVPTSEDYEKLCNNVDFPEHGLPKTNVKMGPLWLQAVENAIAGADRSVVEALNQFRVK